MKRETILVGILLGLGLGASVVAVWQRARVIPADDTVEAIHSLALASEHLYGATARLAAFAGEDTQALRSAWSEALATADKAASEVATHIDREAGIAVAIADGWLARRNGALATLDLVQAGIRAPGSSSVATAATQRRHVAHLGEDRRLADELRNSLDAARSHVRARAEESSRAARLAAFAAVFAFAALGIVVPLQARRLHRRLAEDNAARRAAEESARASERNLFITLNSIGDAVVAVDRHGRIQRLNEVAEHLTGWRQGDAIGRPSHEVLRLTDSNATASVADSIAEVLRTGAPLLRTAGLELERADGSRRHVAENASPIRDADGTIHGVVVVLHDTTVQRALETRLRDVQRMESIGRLAGGVAHEFNNLLQIIIGNTALLRTLVAGDSEAGDYFSRIDVAVQRAATLTNQLLAFGGRQTLVLRNSDLSALVGRSIDVARRILPPDITVEYVRPPFPSVARIDSGQMEQVLVNLCLHARDSMPGGGTIRVSLDEIEIGGAGARTLAAPRIGPYLRIRVSDTGDGMSDEARRRVFEPFFSSTGSVLDAGLGLAAVHGIVQQHGGFVEVESTKGRGTTFTILVPGRSVALQPQRNRNAPPPDLEATRGLVLLAEDEPGVRLMAQRVLERHGFATVAVSDGAEACKVFETRHDEISLVLLDVIMPHMGGVEAARLMRESRPDLPIVFCTGYSDGVLGELQLAKPWRVLHKPYDVGELVDVINRCLGGVEVSTPT
jgi:PAS domain S-box-containing protein